MFLINHRKQQRSTSEIPSCCLNAWGVWHWHLKHQCNKLPATAVKQPSTNQPQDPFDYFNCQYLWPKHEASFKTPQGCRNFKAIFVSWTLNCSIWGDWIKSVQNISGCFPDPTCTFAWKPVLLHHSPFTLPSPFSHINTTTSPSSSSSSSSFISIIIIIITIVVIIVVTILILLLLLLIIYKHQQQHHRSTSPQPQPQPQPQHQPQHQHQHQHHHHHHHHHPHPHPDPTPMSTSLLSPLAIKLMYLKSPSAFYRLHLPQ